MKLLVTSCALCCPTRAGNDLVESCRHRPLTNAFPLNKNSIIMHHIRYVPHIYIQFLCHSLRWRRVPAVRCDSSLQRKTRIVKHRALDHVIPFGKISWDPIASHLCHPSPGGAGSRFVCRIPRPHIQLVPSHISHPCRNTRTGHLEFRWQAFIAADDQRGILALGSVFLR